ncbi:MAG: hypothetical protein JSV18_02910 [Candidatus Bathyarchaeota archaeon]|nr:MAG: hypothetical protein JSV18_02910 [Candidatus Bathyarchaeota archaeon]
MKLDKLERMIISEDWIDWYRNEHKSRARETHLPGGITIARHRHWNLPFCSFCDEEVEEGDECYILFVGGHAVAYHSDCLVEHKDTRKVKNIVAQDRSFRMKMLDKNNVEDEQPLRIKPISVKYIEW